MHSKDRQNIHHQKVSREVRAIEAQANITPQAIQSTSLKQTHCVLHYIINLTAIVNQTYITTKEMHRKIEGNLFFTHISTRQPNNIT